MTAKQLVELVQAEFKDDEEVTFLYHDDQGDVRSSDISIHEHTQETLNGHWEMKQIDLTTHKEEWVKADWETARRSALGRRFVPDGTTAIDTRKVIEIL